MNISKNNIKEKWQAYISNSLSKDEETKMLEFLDKHPQLLDELTESSNNIYASKSNLYDIEISEYLLISKIENCLTQQENEALEKEIAKDKKLAETFSLYQQLRLEPNKNIVYPHKNQLKRKTNIKLYLPFSIAAAIAVLILSFNLLIENVEPAGETITTAKNDNTIFTSQSTNQTASDKTTIQTQNQAKSSSCNNNVIEQQTATNEVRPLPSKNKVSHTETLRMEIAEIQPILVPTYPIEMQYFEELEFIAKNTTIENDTDGIRVVNDTKIRKHLRKKIQDFKNNIENSDITNRITEIKDELTLALINNY